MNLRGVHFELEYLFTAWVFGMIVALVLRHAVMFTVRNIAYFPDSPPSRTFSIKRELIYAAVWAFVGLAVVVLWRINFFEALYVKLRLLMLGKI